ncbi:MAG: MltA domain-containing protein [Thermodesulfobacteriota bacterium]
MRIFSCHRSLRVLFTVWVLLQLLPGCAGLKIEPLPVPPLERVRFSFKLDFSDDLDYDGLSIGISQSLNYLRKIPPDRQFRFGPDLYTTDHLIRTLTHFQEFIETKPLPAELNKFIRSNYRIYRSIGGEETGNVLFTGYYEPILQGSLNKSDVFRYPLYSRPMDLLTIDLSLFSSRFANEKIIGRVQDQTVVPYYDRKEIEQNDSMSEIAAPIAWVNDPVALFFLHIQGSGKISLDNGETIQVHYHTSNGRPYRSIGKLLIEKGQIERDRMSMQAIRLFLKENPAELENILNYNPSYVFFKIEPDGPFGHLNVKLTPGRSIALDRRLFPPAVLAFMETKLPLVNGDGQIQNWTDCTRFVLNQDTGGAIRGPGRADLFWGDGPYAEIAAGFMQHPGNLYFIVLKPDE